MRVLWFAGILMTGAGCLVSAELADKACSSSGACVAGFVCVDNVCVAESGAGQSDVGPTQDARVIDADGSADIATPFDLGASDVGFVDAGQDAGACGGQGQPCCSMADACGAGLACLDGLCSCNEALASNEFFSCALRAGGTVDCSGRNESGQLGSGNTTSTLSPIRTRMPQPVKFLALGAFHSCALTQSDIFCWGRNREGQLGLDTVDRNIAATPTRLPDVPPFPFVNISLGSFHSCGITDGNRVYCWGANDDGQSGVVVQTNDDRRITVPTRVQGLPAGEVMDIAAGAYHSCAVISGDVWCWGRNRNSQLGLAGTTTTAVPLRSEMRGAARVYAGDFHTCALRTDRTVWCWGQNFFGQVGSGFDGGSKLPDEIAGGLRFRDLRAMDDHTCGIAENGDLYCWGRNENGELGLGVQDSLRSSPTRVPIGPVLQVVGGRRHVCALQAAGQVLCWGGLGLGELGTGDDTETATPTASLLGCGL